MTKSKTPSPIRKEDFKIGKWHGVHNAQKRGRERDVQRQMFNCQVMQVIRSRNQKNNSFIRLIAYEMPLGHQRGECVDLVGYDRNRDLYLIELKHSNPTSAVMSGG